ncbi:hypothetical protein HanXRQr2_Chr17g0805681 [Helianthus annuus]|uniref:Uncharacterized protein n=1 Tax=Helianthus annuus TaxID=4232 RepID=A0A9K3GU04_HELAN|nr:hypothetical protein HanXRQr2_Chr17g0805681 [Helianthus annuus]
MSFLMATDRQSPRLVRYIGPNLPRLRARYTLHVLPVLNRCAASPMCRSEIAPRGLWFSCLLFDPCRRSRYMAMIFRKCV